MKLYLSGAVSNNPDYKKKFAENEAKLKAAGYEAVNPCNLPGVNNGEWLDKEIVCLCAIKTVDALALIPDGNDSVGRCIEHEVAYKTGKRVMYVEDWLKEKK